MPILIFLHGLLGTKNDWLKVMEKLPHFNCVAIDLPFHGENKALSVEDFSQTTQYLSQKIAEITNDNPYILIGYSLGGRLALHYALSQHVRKGKLQRLILEGANLGLQTEQERQQRWQNDLQWAQRFANEDIENVLQDWYRQPVFSHLSQQQTAEIIAQRSLNSGESVAKMLLATSLAKQPDFRPLLAQNKVPIDYVVGEKDKKFTAMAKQSALNFYQIANAGHNAHNENPESFAELLAQICV
ncbi:2-succinyl-6-hydroxy-2,4-cyclohexadiene-1-carboxylate synthase [Pasteurellaceae bacterium 22721_9_1]